MARLELESVRYDMGLIDTNITAITDQQVSALREGLSISFFLPGMPLAEARAPYFEDLLFETTTRQT